MVRVFSSGEQKQSAPSESCHRLSCRLLSHASSHLFTVMLDESSDSSIMSCYFELDAQVSEKDFSGRISLQYFHYKNLLSSSNSSVSFLRTELQPSCERWQEQFCFKQSWEIAPLCPLTSLSISYVTWQPTLSSNYWRMPS